MDENQFRAEIAEIFREQDRRFERSQKRMDRMEAVSEKRFAASEKRIVASEKRLDRIVRLQDKNTLAIASLQKTVSDFMDIYQFREQSADRMFDNLNARLDALKNELK